VVNVGGVTPAESVAWGSITGTLSAQTDLQTALDLKYDASNPSAFIDATALASYAPLNAPSFTSGITADGGVTIPGPSGSYVITYSGIQFPDATTQTTAAVSGANFGDAFTVGKVQDVSPSGGYWVITFAPVNAAVTEVGIGVSLSDGTSYDDVTGSYSTTSTWTYTTTTLEDTEYIYLTVNSQRSSIPISQP
jgi:hypothetical protein